MSKVPITNVTLRKVGIVSILLVLCIVLFWVFACWAILDGGYFLTSLAFPDPPRWKPLVSDIVGKWSLSDESIRLVEDSGTEMPLHEIEFHSNGTFNSTNLPILHEWSNERIDLVFYTGTGTWEFDKMRFKPWAIVLYYEYVEGLPTRPLYYFLRGREPPYKMDETPLVFERK